MKKFINSRFGVRAVKGSLVAGSVVLASNANAALPAEATTALGDVTTFATDMIAAAWPIVGLIAVGMIGIKLFKKFTNKAT